MTRRFPRRPKPLLRMLGETRGRDSFLRAAASWQPTPKPLEDEHPEEPFRQRKQQLARRCRPFLERFFRAWDEVELEKSATATVADLKSLADEIGLSRANTKDLSDLECFWGELDRWAREESANDGRETLTREQFARVLSAVGTAPCRADGTQLRSGPALRRACGGTRVRLPLSCRPRRRELARPGRSSLASRRH